MKFDLTAQIKNWFLDFEINLFEKILVSEGSGELILYIRLPNLNFYASTFLDNKKTFFGYYVPSLTVDVDVNERKPL